MSSGTRWLIGAIVVPLGLTFFGSYAVLIVKLERLEAVVEADRGRQDRLGEAVLKLLMGEMEGRE